MTELISFQTAKLAREKGFNWNVNKTYFGHHNPPMAGSDLSYKTSNKTLGDTIYAAPTQSLLQKWLREKHDIDIMIHLIYTNTTKIHYCANVLPDGINGQEFYLATKNTYEKALESGVKKALELIKKHG